MFSTFRVIVSTKTGEDGKKKPLTFAGERYKKESVKHVILLHLNNQIINEKRN